MTPKVLATLAAATSLLFGVAGLAVPQVFGTAFGLTLDPTSTALVRLACASYIAFGVLAWLARDLTDAAAWRAVAGASAVSWGLSAVVVATAIVSGLGDSRAWVMVAMQIVFAVAWSLVLVRPRVAHLAPG